MYYSACCQSGRGPTRPDRPDSTTDPPTGPSGRSALRHSGASPAAPGALFRTNRDRRRPLEPQGYCGQRECRRIVRVRVSLVRPAAGPAASFGTPHQAGGVGPVDTVPAARCRSDISSGFLVGAHWPQNWPAPGQLWATATDRRSGLLTHRLDKQPVSRHIADLNVTLAAFLAEAEPNGRRQLDFQIAEEDRRRGQTSPGRCGAGEGASCGPRGGRAPGSNGGQNKGLQTIADELARRHKEASSGVDCRPRPSPRLPRGYAR